LLSSEAFSLLARPPRSRRPKPQLRTVDEEFSKQLSELKRTFADLSKKFDESAQTIDRLNSAEAARKEIEELREHVGRLLGAVADNGAVWSLGTKALRRADEKLKALETETHYKEEDRQFLMARWRELKAATEDAIKELEGARKEFAELLRASCKPTKISSRSRFKSRSTRGRSRSFTASVTASATHPTNSKNC
jgi:DNA repair exonuclease SbcCD ATPase subunit